MYNVWLQIFEAEATNHLGICLLKLHRDTTLRMIQNYFTAAWCDFNKTHFSIWIGLSFLSVISAISSPSFRAWPLLRAIPPERKLHNHWPVVRGWSCGSVHLWPRTRSRTRAPCYRVHQCEGSLLERHRASMQRWHWAVCRSIFVALSWTSFFS